MAQGKKTRGPVDLKLTEVDSALPPLTPRPPPSPPSPQGKGVDYGSDYDEDESTAIGTGFNPDSEMSFQATLAAMGDSEPQVSSPAPSPMPPEEELSLPEGSRVRQYEIIREIGRGGMGRVLLARDTVRKRPRRRVTKTS